jgi:hypothetical protein
MGRHDGTVEHQILVVSVRRQPIKYPLPDAGMTPTAEAAMHSLPFPIAFRQVTPMRTRPQPPPNIRLRTRGDPSLCGPDHQPYRAQELQSSTIAPRSVHIASLSSQTPGQNIVAYESSITPLGNPEHRSDLKGASAI